MSSINQIKKMKTAGDIQGLIKVLKNHKDNGFFERHAAVQALGEIRDTCVIEPLIEALGDLDIVHKAAAEALIKIGAPTVKPLIKALKDGGIFVRRGSAYALGAIADSRAVEPLI